MKSLDHTNPFSYNAFEVFVTAIPPKGLVILDSISEATGGGFKWICQEKSVLL
jgi:hypothetical protein